MSNIKKNEILCLKMEVEILVLPDLLDFAGLVLLTVADWLYGLCLLEYRLKSLWPLMFPFPLLISQML